MEPQQEKNYEEYDASRPGLFSYIGLAAMAIGFFAIVYGTQIKAFFGF